MPSVAAHYICGTLVAKKLNISSSEYIKGNIFPDYVDKSKHYRVQGRMFQVPDLDRFMKEEDIKNTAFKLGFLTHLMLDRLFLDEFVVNNIYSKVDKRINIFVPDKIYTDYTNISKRLLSHYNLSLDSMDSLILDGSVDIDINEYKSNTDIIRRCTSEELKYLNLPDFITFLDDSSTKISEYVKKKKFIR